ncbi:MAG: hypothetical protein ABI573_06260 [Chloroflexota bacterium]
MIDPFDEEPPVSGVGLQRLDSDGADDLSAIPSFLRGESGGSELLSASSDPGDRSATRRDRVISSPPRPVVVLGPDPGAIPMATISPRRLLHIVAAIAISWGVISFGRQVATASAASGHADELRAANVAVTDQVAAMQRELTLIQEQRFVDLQARAYRLGTRDEIAFALKGGAPSLPADAPGSASVRLGADAQAGSPIDRWFDLLFGPGG